MSGTVEESVRTGGDPGLSSFLGIAFITGPVTIDLPLYHRDRYMFGDIPSFCLARVMRLVRLHSLSIVIDVVEFVCLSITTTSMVRLTPAFLLVTCGVGFSCPLLLLVAMGPSRLKSEVVSVFSW